MQWLIQDSGVDESFLQNNVRPLESALRARNIPFTAITLEEDLTTIGGLDGLDRSTPTFFYGSNELAEAAIGARFYPGSFYNRDWFNPLIWAGKRDDLLNPDPRESTIGNLRRDWTTRPIFVKSIRPKILTGMVLEGPDAAWWLEQYKHLDEEEPIVLSPVHIIDQEWRFFLAGGSVVAGSQYRHDGLLRIREPILPAVWDVAREMATGWLPDPDIAIDLCLTRDKHFRIVEFTCVNAAAFYNADVGAYVEAMEAVYGFSPSLRTADRADEI